LLSGVTYTNLRPSLRRGNESNVRDREKSFFSYCGSPIATVVPSSLLGCVVPQTTLVALVVLVPQTTLVALVLVPQTTLKAVTSSSFQGIVATGAIAVFPFTSTQILENAHALDDP